MAYLFFGLIVFYGALVLSSALISFYVLIFGKSRGLDSPEDGHTRAEEREERWYPLR